MHCVSEIFSMKSKISSQKSTISRETLVILSGIRKSQLGEGTRPLPGWEKERRHRRLQVWPPRRRKYKGRIHLRNKNEKKKKQTAV